MIPTEKLKKKNLHYKRAEGEIKNLQEIKRYFPIVTELRKQKKNKRERKAHGERCTVDPKQDDLEAHLWLHTGSQSYHIFISHITNPSQFLSSKVHS